MFHYESATDYSIILRPSSTFLSFSQVTGERLENNLEMAHQL